MPQDKLPIPQFAAKIKAKYPQYKDIEDTVLVQKILAKYPEYNEQVDMSGVIKKKEPTSVGSAASSMALAGGGQVGSSKAQYGGLTDYSIEGVEKYAEQYNKKFEDETGHRELNLNAPVKPKSVLGQQGYKKRKGDFELKKMQKYRDVEEKEITPLKLKVVTGEVKPSELSDLYNKPYGKKIVGDIINSQVPELGSMALESDVYGNEQKWQNIAHAINVKNIGKGIDLTLQENDDVSNYLNDVIGFGLLKKSYQGSVSPTTGIVASDGGTELKPINKYDISNPKDLGLFLQDVIRADELVGDKFDGGGKNSLINKIKSKLFFLKTQEPIAEEINNANISGAVLNVNRRLERGKSKFQTNDKINEEHFKLGLNYVKDSDPALYANVMRSIRDLGDIPDTDYEGIASLGQDIYNKKIYLQSAQNPELVGKQTDIKYSSYQSEKQKYSQVLSEEIKRLGYGNKGRVPTKAIEDAWKLHPELDNAEIVNDIAKDEAAGGYGIVKSGWLNKRMNAIAEPFKDMNRLYNSIVDSPAETYYNSKRLDYGDQKLLDNEGNIVDRLPSDSYGMFDKILDGAAKIASQVLLTKGIGTALKAPISFGLSQVPRAALTAKQGANIVNIGGTFSSTYLQTYGNSYIDFLEKTGDPNKAALMATIDGLGTAALESFISPDVKIADKAAQLLKSKKVDFVKDLASVIEGKGGRAAAGQVIKKFVSESSGIMAGQIAQEDLQQVENFLVEGIFSPRTVEDRNLGKELINTTKETALATVIPALLGGGGATKAQKKLTREGLHTIAINLDSYKETLDKAVVDGMLSDKDYQLAMGILQKHKGNIDNAPKRDSKGELISMERQMEYAFQSTVEQIYTERAEQQDDKVQREPLEEKAKEAQEIKRKIFGGEAITGLPKQEKVDKDDQKSVEETRLLEIASQALNKVAPVMGQDGTEMVVNDGNHIQRAVEVFGKDDVTKAVQLSLQKELADNQAQFEEIENPTEGDREYFKETEEEIKQKHEDALRKIEEVPTKGEPEQISQPIELDPNLPEGFGEEIGDTFENREVIENNLKELGDGVFYHGSDDISYLNSKEDINTKDNAKNAESKYINLTPNAKTAISYSIRQQKIGDKSGVAAFKLNGNGYTMKNSDIKSLKSNEDYEDFYDKKKLEGYDYVEVPQDANDIVVLNNNAIEYVGKKLNKESLGNTQSGIKEATTEGTIPEQVQPEVDVKSQKEALEVEKQNAITQATKPKVELELLGETEEQVIDLISDKASKDKDGGKAKIRQHERIRAKLQALKDLIDCV